MNTNTAPVSQINPKLVNIAVALVIVCAVLFIALWAVPLVQQSIDKAKQDAENGQTAAGKFLLDYYNENVFKGLLSEVDYTSFVEALPDKKAALAKAKATVPSARVEELIAEATQPMAVAYYFAITPKYKLTGQSTGWHEVVIVYKTEIDGDWNVK